VREAKLARLDETIIESISMNGESVAFTAPPRATVTILVR
jgi:hypothetical protein